MSKSDLLTEDLGITYKNPYFSNGFYPPVSKSRQKRKKNLQNRRKTIHFNFFHLFPKSRKGVGKVFFHPLL